MVDGYFIRSLLLAFFFKVFPEIVLDGRIYIAEPPLYRVDDKSNPFVVNTAEYIDRYAKTAMKYYKVGYLSSGKIEFLDKKMLYNFLSETSDYTKCIDSNSRHFKINERLLEMLAEEFAMIQHGDESLTNNDIASRVNIQTLIDRINTEFGEIYYDDKLELISGSIDTVQQLIDISPNLVKKTKPLIKSINSWGDPNNYIILKDVKTSTEHKLSLLGVLKILNKFKPGILHRFKGLQLFRSPTIFNFGNV